MSAKEPLPQRLRLESCTWDGCQQQPSNFDLATHLQGHARDAQARWTPNSSCSWQGCKSKSRFKNQRQFVIHLENIHTKPLLCTKTHCSHKRPFRNEHDLQRHNSTMHCTERPWECPYDFCPSEIRTFARKDKWLQHIQETQHENDAFCPFGHCRLEQVRSGKPFENRKEIGQHFGGEYPLQASRDLDGYPCGLGSCAMIGGRE